MFNYLFAFIYFVVFIQLINCQVSFQSLCSADVQVSGMSAIDGSEDFEIDLYETRFLPDDTILFAIKQKQQNYGINEFVVRAFDYEGNIIGRFDDQQTGHLNLQHYPCSNGASVIYVDRVDNRGYREIPLAWKASGIHPNIDEVVFKADIVSNRQLYHVESSPLRRRSSLRINSYADDHSLNVDYCGESQGCLIVPQQCNNNAKCEYILSWQGLDSERVKFNLIARAQGFAGVGFSTDEKRGHDQVVICTKDSQGHVYVHNTYTDVQTARYIQRERPSYGLREAEGYSNGTHIICQFTRKLSSHVDSSVEREGVDRDKFVDLKQPHYIYPIYSNEDLMTPQGMRIPLQDIPIVNNHPVNFQRRIWPKSHPRAGSFLAKLHAILNIIAWVLLASAGVLVARYFDSVWPEYERRVVVDGSGNVTGEKLQRRRQFSYFAILPPLMLTVAILTWIAFFCILAELNWTWTSGNHQMWHSILGVIVLVSAFLAPIVGILRPPSRTKRYCVWYWIHWIIVSLAHCLAIPVIFLGMDIPRLDLWAWCSWLLFAWCIFHFIVQLIFEIAACCRAREEYQRFENGEVYIEKHPNRPIYDNSWKIALLSIYLAVTFIVVVALVIAVILYDGY